MKMNVKTARAEAEKMSRENIGITYYVLRKGSVGAVVSTQMGFAKKFYEGYGPVCKYLNGCVQ